MISSLPYSLVCQVTDATALQNVIWATTHFGLKRTTEPSLWKKEVVLYEER